LPKHLPSRLLRHDEVKFEERASSTSDEYGVAAASRTVPRQRLFQVCMCLIAQRSYRACHAKASFDSFWMHRVRWRCWIDEAHSPLAQ